MGLFKKGENPDVTELRAEIESLRRIVKAFDRDLSDAIDGFYRRRQADKMREVREEQQEQKPKRLTDRDILLKAIEKSGTPSSD
jgi:hypothetical protein